MLKHPFNTGIVATLYLLTFVLLLQFQVGMNLVYLMFFFSPLVILSLAWSILRHGRYTGNELTEHEQWGYQDKQHKNNWSFLLVRNRSSAANCFLSTIFETHTSTNASLFYTSYNRTYLCSYVVQLQFIKTK